MADWYPNIAKELRKFGIDFDIPDLPGGGQPHAGAWLEALHTVIQKSAKPLILVGHSLGTRALLLYVEKYKPKVEKAFLIAAFANRIENAKRHNSKTYPDFFKTRVDIDTIRSLVGKFIVLLSLDDSSIRYEHGVSIAQDLHAQLITCNGKDHLSSPDDALFILHLLRKELHF